MKKVLVVIIILSLVIISMPVFAAEGGKKGASERAYERASPQAIFHRIEDWFATRGKSPEEKESILKERRAERAVKRAEKEARKAQKETERVKKTAEKEVEKAKRKLKRQENRRGKKGKGKK